MELLPNNLTSRNLLGGESFVLIVNSHIASWKNHHKKKPDFPPIAWGTTCRLVEDPTVPLYYEVNQVICCGKNDNFNSNLEVS